MSKTEILVDTSLKHKNAGTEHVDIMQRIRIPVLLTKITNHLDREPEQHL
jgi:hypothetical protein